MDENIKVVIEETKKYFDAKQAETLERINTLQTETAHRFDEVDKKFTKIDERFDEVDKKFTKIDERFDGVDQKLGQINQRFDKVEDKIQIVFEQVVANTEDLSIIKSDLGTIKHELKQRVSYDEFAALEQRVIAIESKMAKVN